MASQEISLDVVIKYLQAAGYSEDKIKRLTSEPLYGYVKQMIEEYISFHQGTLIPAITRIPFEERTEEMNDNLDPLNTWRPR